MDSNYVSQDEIADAELMEICDEIDMEEEWHNDITDEEMIAIDADDDDDEYFIDDLPSSGSSNYTESVFTRSPGPHPPGGYPPLIIALDDDGVDDEDDDDDDMSMYTS